MTRSELQNAPTALLNRFQKILFTADDFLVYTKSKLEKACVESKINECKKTCEDLVTKCGRKMFPGYSDRNTISSIIMSSLRDDGKFMCPRPYERLFSDASAEQVPKQTDNTNAMEMLMLTARPEILQLSTLDESLKRAYKYSQKHNSVVDLIVELKDKHHCTAICWNVFTEMNMSLLYFKSELKKALGDSLSATFSIVSLSSESRSVFEKDVDKAFKTGCDKKHFIICLADMNVCSLNNVNYAKRYFEKRKDEEQKTNNEEENKKKDGMEKKDGEGKNSKKYEHVFVILVQLFPRKRVYDLERYCTAFFSPRWRCTFVKDLLSDARDDASNRASDYSERITALSDARDDGNNGALGETFQRFFNVLKKFSSYMDDRRSEALSYLYNKTVGKKNLSDYSQDEIQRWLFLVPEQGGEAATAAAAPKPVSLLDVIEDFAVFDTHREDKLSVFCEEHGYTLDAQIMEFFGDWEMDELYCLVVYWCQRHVHEEEKFRCSKGVKLLLEGEQDEQDDKYERKKSEVRKHVLLSIVDEFRSLMQSGDFLKEDKHVIRCLGEAQSCCRLDDRIEWKPMFKGDDDTHETDKTNETDEIDEKSKINQALRNPCKCCISAMHNYKAFVEQQTGLLKGARVRAQFVEEICGVASLVFMRPSFVHICRGNNRMDVEIEQEKRQKPSS